MIKIIIPPFFSEHLLFFYALARKTRTQLAHIPRGRVTGNAACSYGFNQAKELSKVQDTYSELLLFPI